MTLVRMHAFCMSHSPEDASIAWLLVTHVLTVLHVHTEMCFKVSEDYSNVVAAWRAAVDIATTYIRNGRHVCTAIMIVVFIKKRCSRQPLPDEAAWEGEWRC